MERWERDCRDKMNKKGSILGIEEENFSSKVDKPASQKLIVSERK
jgi:hypothetical protein